MRYLFWMFSIAIGLGYTACVPPDGTPEIVSIELDLRDSTLRHIFNLKDKQHPAALQSFLLSENPNYRFAAARAYGSISNADQVDSLAMLLKDPFPQIREAAAFSLGQMGDPAATPYLLQAFERKDSLRIFAASNGAILEAVGKTGAKKELDLLATISSYTPTDTALLLGQAYGIYRFGLREIFSKKGTEKMLSLATDDQLPAEVRMVAAQYLARFRAVELENRALELSNAFTREDAAIVRMPLALAVGKTGAKDVIPVLTSQFGLERDPLVQTNILRALYKFDYEAVKPTFERALRSKNPQVAQVAADFFHQRGTVTDAYSYYTFAKDTLIDRFAVTTLLAAANRYLPAAYETAKGAINYRAKRIFESSSDPYEQAAALQALAEFGWNYRYIKEKGFISSEPVVRVGSMQAFKRITDNPDFERFFGAGAWRVTRDLLGYAQEAFEIGDVGMVAVGAEMLRSPNVNFKSAIDSLDFLKTAMRKLELPQEIEAYNALEATLAYFEERDPQPATPKYNHPIAWELLERLVATSTARITTSKGEIAIQLFPTETPGTVANFIDLIRQGYYKNKTFHRVVPNFVTQGGCPRGDGYGAADHTIRSDFTPRRYNQAGYLGMASAGKDTESVQFFITHSPAIHLDGKYSLFGKVVDGIDVVNKLEIGDKILNVAILNE